MAMRRVCTRVRAARPRASERARALALVRRCVSAVHSCVSSALLVAAAVECPGALFELPTAWYVRVVCVCGGGGLSLMNALPAR